MSSSARDHSCLQFPDCSLPAFAGGMGARVSLARPIGLDEDVQYLTDRTLAAN